MSIQVQIDATNPGQFLACCGLLESADRVCPGAEGWFEANRFCISCEINVSALFDLLMKCTLTNNMTPKECAKFAELSFMTAKERSSLPGFEEEYKALAKQRREAPLILKAPGDSTLDMTFDWFVDSYAGGSRYKTWAGMQSVFEIATAMKGALADGSCWDESCLTFSVTGRGLPFNFDSDLGGQGSAIDIGFSFDPLAENTLTRIETKARPALEFLAFVGLQRFRPLEIKNRNRFLYTLWDQPLPVEVAAPAACGALAIADARRFEFRLLYRTKYLKSFLPAVPYSGDSDE